MKYEIEKGRLIHCSPDIPDKWVSTLRPRIRVCTQELDLVIPSNVTSISRTAFDEIYPYIKTVVLPDGLNSLLSGLFKHFVSLEELVIGEGPKAIPAGFLKDNISLKKVVIPSTVKTISKGAFRDPPAKTEIRGSVYPCARTARLCRYSFYESRPDA